MQTDLKMTPRREKILEMINEDHWHPTAEELLSALRKEIPSISLGTVYRNLDILAERGLIKILEGGAQRRYDGNVEDHYHIHCMECGAIEDVPADSKPRFEKRASENTKFEILGHKIEFSGLCPVCKRKNKYTQASND